MALEKILVYLKEPKQALVALRLVCRKYFFQSFYFYVDGFLKIICLLKLLHRFLL